MQSPFRYWRRISTVVCWGVSLAFVLLNLAACNTARAAGRSVTSTSVGQSSYVVPTAVPTSGMTVERWNALNGCADGPPLPLPTAIFSGYNPARRGPVPKEVALTFDDGPNPTDTPRIIDILSKTHTPATFMVVGKNAAKWPNLVRNEWAHGFPIGVHSWDHKNFLRLTDAEIHDELQKTTDTFHRILGQDTCIWFWRPPYGYFNNHTLTLTSAVGLTTINWDNAGVDWILPGPKQIVAYIKRLLAPDNIILLHDGPANRAQTVAALPAIIALLKANGYTPVTIPQLLCDNAYPGVHLVPVASHNESVDVCGNALTPAGTPTPGAGDN